ncbi:multiple C2 and transmembrane domain-containing protein 1-like isoform X4 [Pomacea canaliculata]|uniref:multiple C2 and transmembrane domain-containing protein 1-like isoform X4 n=1 Tax=Pomacea canaliculata TaxID=400727 RepID=UPI000D73BA88|nr:multiple C2 and transmembrane domain-containing protein 1-like isoform X4 [Pomacea canaliculata]
MSGEPGVPCLPKETENEDELRNICADAQNGEALDVLGEERRWSLRNLSSRHRSESNSDSKKIKDRKSKSSSDVRHDDGVHNALSDSMSPSPDTPPSPPATGPPTSRRKKIWNSFRKRTRRLRGKSRDKDNRDFPLSLQATALQPDTCGGTEDEHAHVEGSASSVGISRLPSYTTQPYSTSNASVREYVEDYEWSPKKVSVNGTSDTIADFADSRVEEDDDGDVRIAVVEETAVDPSLKPRSNALMDHPFFLLEVRLREGKDLVVRDSCGTSDPYVKFKVGGKQVYKSRIVYKNLNPRWDETFTIPVDDVQKPVNVKVFDHDRALYDDPMGSADIDLSQLELEKPSELKLMLSDRGKSDYMGYLVLTCTLTPKTQEDKDQQFLRRSVRSMESSKKLKLQSWSGVLTVTLVDGWNLLSMDDNGLSDPYVKFKLGNEKYRSRHKSKTLNPRWLEQFDLRLFDDQSMQLEISVYDHDVTGKDDFMGRATIDLSQLEPEVTHTIEQELEDGGGMVRLLLTMSGTSRGDASSDLCNFTPISRDLDDICRKYSLLRSFKNMSDVGYLQVIVYRAVGLKSADFGGQSDPFCVLELVNARVQTHTEYKTLNPEWSKVFTFKVRDIHSVLEVTVYDEDRDKKVEFLGKVAIPLLRVRSGEVQWYALKDKKLMHREKGSIQLKIDFVFNHVKAAIRTVNPAEEKFMQIEPKFRINTMKRNVDRVSQLIGVLLDGGRFLQSCFSWESTSRSATAFIAFLVIVWNFELYMLPISLLLIFLKNMLVAQVVGALKREPVEEDTNDDDDDEEEEDKDKSDDLEEEKKTFKEKLQSIQDVCLKVQETMDMVACLGERIKNTFNWSVPWLSALAMVALSVAVVVLYFIPIRILILLWGINKFTKKLRSPNAINNNELLDFLSRVPCDSQLVQYREFRPDETVSPGTKKKRS